MSPDPTARAGFARPAGYLPRRQRSAMLAQLIASLALAVSIAVVATAVSIGIARADALAPVENDGSRLAAASIIAVLLAGMGGVTAVATHERLRDRPGTQPRV